MDCAIVDNPSNAPGARQQGRLQEFYRVATAHGLFSTPRRLRFYAAFLFEGVPLQGKTVLDIGGGNGMASLYAAARGAARVVCLEPDAAGSTAGQTSNFHRAAEALDLRSVELRRQTFQEFDAPSGSFDVILLQNSVNHLDERACIRLQNDDEALRRYRELFAKVAALAADGASVILTDCSSRNLFPGLGLPNPFCPQIEWHKHQPPEVWRGLFEELGFRPVKLSWSSFVPLGAAGKLLLGNRLAAFCLRSHFRLHLRKVGKTNVGPMKVQPTPETGVVSR